MDFYTSLHRDIQNLPYQQPWYTWPEHLCLILERQILNAIMRFDSLQSLEEHCGIRQVQIARKRLVLWQCLDTKERITGTGRFVLQSDTMQIPFALMMKEAIREHVADDVAAMVAILEIGPVIKAPNDASRALVHGPGLTSDIIAQLQLYHHFQTISVAESELFDVIHEHVHAIQVRRDQILWELKEQGPERPMSVSPDYEAIRHCFLSGMYLYLFMQHSERTYVQPERFAFAGVAFPSFLDDTTWVVGFPRKNNVVNAPPSSAWARHVQQTGKSLIGCTAVDPAELAEMHPELVRTTRSPSVYNKETRFVSFQKTTQYLSHIIHSEEVVNVEATDHLSALHPTLMSHASALDPGTPPKDPHTVYVVTQSLRLSFEEAHAFHRLVDQLQAGTVPEEVATAVLGKRLFAHLHEEDILCSQSDHTVSLNEETLNKTRFKIANLLNRPFYFRMIPLLERVQRKEAWIVYWSQCIQRARVRSHIPPEPIGLVARLCYLSRQDAKNLLSLIEKRIFSRKEFDTMLSPDLRDRLFGNGCITKQFHFDFQRFGHTEFRVYDGDPPKPPYPKARQALRYPNWWINHLRSQVHPEQSAASEHSALEFTQTQATL